MLDSDFLTQLNKQTCNCNVPKSKLSGCSAGKWHEDGLKTDWRFGVENNSD